MGRWSRRARAGATAGVLVAVLVAVVALLAGGVPSVPSPPTVGAPAAAASPPPSPAPRVEDPAPPVEPRSPVRPNVVVFLVDDMRADDLAWMPRTRRLLARRGTSFDAAVSPHPLCCPARAGLLTGQYAQNNGVQHNDGPYGGYAALDPRSTVATWLQRAGYRTALVGKHLNQYERSQARDPGWTYFKPLVAHTYEFVRFQLRGEPVREGYVTDAIAARTRKAIIRFAADRAPFFVLASHLAPHGTNIGGVGGPPLPEPAHAAAYPRARPPSFDDPAYDEADMSDKPAPQRGRARVDDAEVRRHFLARIRSLVSVDEAVARTVRLLRRLGELERTYLVFTSDNGYALGEHRYTYKNVLSDEVLRVPLLVRGPGVPAGGRDGRVATLVDLTATVVDLAGARPGRPLDGASLAPAWRARGTGARDAWRDTTLVQTGRVAEAGDPSSGWATRGVLTDRYLFGHAPGRPAVRFLYDHRTDPHELRNVAESPRYAAVVRALTRRTRVLGTCAGAACHRTFGPLPAP